MTGVICLAALDTNDAFMEPSFVPRDGAVRVRHMLVAPERQRRGIGRQLIDAAFDWARQAGYSTIVLETTPQQEAAVDFYRALAFQEIGRSTIGRWELVWFEHTVG